LFFNKQVNHKTHYFSIAFFFIIRYGHGLEITKQNDFLAHGFAYAHLQLIFSDENFILVSL